MNELTKNILVLKQLIKEAGEVSDQIKFNYCTTVLFTLLGLLESADIKRIERLAKFASDISIEVINEYSDKFLNRKQKDNQDRLHGDN